MGDQFLCSDEVALSDALQQIGAKNILVLGPQMRWQLHSFLTAHKHAQISHANLKELKTVIAPEQHYDCILVAEVLENMSKPQARAWLDALPQWADHVFVRVQLGKAWLKQASLWEPQDIRSMGYDLLGLMAEFGRPVGLFRFNAHAYKTRTEWLNSRYWAQPD